MEVTVGGTRIESKRAIKYLGVTVDDKLNYKEHVKYIYEKASITQEALARMKPDFGGPCPFKRRIIFFGSNIDNIVCFPNMVGGTLSGDDKENTVLGVPSKRDQTDKRLQDSV